MSVSLYGTINLVMPIDIFGASMAQPDLAKGLISRDVGIHGAEVDTRLIAIQIRDEDQKNPIEAVSENLGINLSALEAEKNLIIIKPGMMPETRVPWLDWDYLQANDYCRARYADGEI